MSVVGPHLHSIGGSVAALTDAAISMQGVGVWREGRWLVHDITLEIARGACVQVRGANGSGKTTLLRVMAGLLRATRGRTELFGCEPMGKGAMCRVGLIGHEPMLYDRLTALENVELFARLHGVRDAGGRARGALERVGLGAASGQAAGTLSRGMLQRAAIARALVHDPEIILADEPLAGLDEQGAAIVVEALRDLHGRGATLVVTGHDPDPAAGGAREPGVMRAGDRLVVLREGSVASNGRWSGGPRGGAP